MLRNVITWALNVALAADRDRLKHVVFGAPVVLT